MLRKAVREFANKKIAPNVDEWGKEHYFSYEEVMKPMGELGFWGTVNPEEYKGEDMGWMKLYNPESMKLKTRSFCLYEHVAPIGVNREKYS